ncbi:MAG TPA: hypothetical protein PKH09_03300 [Parvularculaceae bacterium]|nr:hypothetical protein [Parvularculaceae bacterium]
MENTLENQTGTDEGGAIIADEAETAEYIGDLIGQLERLARSHGLVKLQYLLGVCREEAAKVAAGEQARSRL